MDIKKIIPQWNKNKFSDQNLNNELIFTKHKNKIINIFKDLKIFNLPMNGYSTESLPKTSENGAGLNYSTVFHKLINKKEINPALFLATYISDYLETDLNEEKLIGFAARGLRTFASLIREQDFAIKIEEYLKQKDKSLEINMDPEQDTKSHVDIKIKFKNNIFNLWTYQASKNAIYPHTIERVTGQRGELENGLHVLCPLNTELGQTLLKKRNSLQLNLPKIKKWEEDLNEKKTNKQKEKLTEQINKKKIYIEELKKNISDLEKNCQDLEIIEGWFLYSDLYIKTISEKISDCEKQKIYNYKELVNTFLAPEKILKSINFFKK